VPRAALDHRAALSHRRLQFGVGTIRGRPPFGLISERECSCLRRIPWAHTPASMVAPVVQLSSARVGVQARGVPFGFANLRRDVVVSVMFN
jgi:hypothetical protein